MPMPAPSSRRRASEKVKALVYVAALAPDEGETVADVFYRAEPHPQAPKLAPDGHGLIYLPEEAFAAAFAQNASAEEQAVLAAVQRPISPACITVAVGAAAVEGPSDLVPGRREDRMIVARNSALHGRADEGADALASGRSHADRDRALRRRGHHPRGDREVALTRPQRERARVGNLRTPLIELRTEEKCHDRHQVSNRRRGRLQDLLSRGGRAGRAEAAAASRLPERGPHVPRSHPAAGRPLPHRRPRSAGLRQVRHAGARQFAYTFDQHRATRSTASPRSSASTAMPSTSSTTARRPASGSPSSIRTGSRRSSRRTATPMRKA